MPQATIRTLLLAIALLQASGSSAVAFRGLGALPGGDGWSSAYGLSADGSTVVGESPSSSGTEAFRWTAAGGMIGLGDLPGGDFSSGVANYEGGGISADGSVIVGYSYSSSGLEAFRWTEAGGMVGLGDLPGGDFNSLAHSATADGSTVVGVSAASTGDKAFQWTPAGGMVALQGFPLVSPATQVWISADGSTITTRGDNDGRAFRWSATHGFESLGDLPGGAVVSTPNGIAANGQTIVGQSSSDLGFEPFRWTKATGMIGLGVLKPGDSGNANDVSADGSIVIGDSFDEGKAEAFLWTATEGLQNLRAKLINEYGLDLTGWSLTSATAISDDGMTIVGWGTNPAGNDEGWIVNLDGDLNFDGATDGADFLEWQRGDASAAALSAWKSHFGDDAEGGVSAARGIPEPGAARIAILAGVGCFALLRRPRRWIAAAK